MNTYEGKEEGNDKMKLTYDTCHKFGSEFALEGVPEKISDEHDKSVLYFHRNNVNIMHVLSGN